MEYLVLNGYFSCLIYMHEIGAKWTNTVIASALSKNDFKVVKYVIENNTSNRWDYKTCLDLSMQYNCLEAIKYFHEASADWMGLTCTKIVEKGSLECLQYARERGCPFDEETCEESVRTGHLDCLKYVHENVLELHDN